jgi:hypothetical protein
LEASLVYKQHLFSKNKVFSVLEIEPRSSCLNEIGCFCFVVVCLFVVLGLELGAYMYLKPFHQPFFVMGFFKIGSHTLPTLASNCDPSDLCLLSS